MLHKSLLELKTVTHMHAILCQYWIPFEYILQRPWFFYGMKDQGHPIGRPQGEHKPRRVSVCWWQRHRELAEYVAQHDLVLSPSEVPPNAYPTPKSEGQVPQPMLAPAVEALFEPLRSKLIHIVAPKWFVVVHSHNVDPHVSSLGDNYVSNSNIFSSLPLGVRRRGVQSKDLAEHPFHLPWVSERERERERLGKREKKYIYTSWK